VRANSSLSGRPATYQLVSAMALLVVIWSANYTVGKIGLRELAPLALASFRIVVAGLTMVPVLILSGCRRADDSRADQTRFSHCASPPKQTLPSPRDMWTFAYLGFFGIVMNQGGFTVGLNYTSVSHSSLIIGAAPILILLLAWTLGLERLTGRKLFGLGLAFAGAALLGSEGGWNVHSAGFRGDLVTLIAAVGLATYTVLGKRVAATYDPVRLNIYSNLSAAVFVLPVAAWQVRRLTITHAWTSIGWQGWGAVVYMGVLSSALCYMLYFWALRFMTASRLGAVSYLQPVGATLLGMILLGEKLTRPLVIGGALVLAGVYAIQTNSRARSDCGER
jgi:drug/metabolite transporter (DMT)-like permease